MDFETFVSSRSGVRLCYLTTTLNSRHHLPKSAVGIPKVTVLAPGAGGAVWAQPPVGERYQIVHAIFSRALLRVQLLPPSP